MLASLGCMPSQESPLTSSLCETLCEACDWEFEGDKGPAWRVISCLAVSRWKDTKQRHAPKDVAQGSQSCSWLPGNQMTYEHA